MSRYPPDQIKAALDAMSADDRALALTKASLRLARTPAGSEPLHGAKSTNHPAARPQRGGNIRRIV